MMSQDASPPDSAATAQAKLVNISIAEGASGMFFATCESEPTFFISAVTLPALWAAIPAALEYMCKSKYNWEIKPIPIDQGNFQSKPWALIPREILEKKASEGRVQLESTSQ